MTATAPASSAILACSALITSMITPPLSISAMPRFTRAVPSCGALAEGVLEAEDVGLDPGDDTGTSLDVGTTARGAPPPWYGLIPVGEIFTPGRLFVDLSLAVVVEEHDPHLAGVHGDFLAAVLPGGAVLRLWTRPGDRPHLAITDQQCFAAADGLGGRCHPAVAVAELRGVGR